MEQENTYFMYGRKEKDEVYEQAMRAIQQEDFTASWRLVTVEGSV